MKKANHSTKERKKNKKEYSGLSVPANNLHILENKLIALEKGSKNDLINNDNYTNKRLSKLLNFLTYS